jgi:hypothetical protein
MLAPAVVHLSVRAVRPRGNGDDRRGRNALSSRKLWSSSGARLPREGWRRAGEIRHTWHIRHPDPGSAGDPLGIRQRSAEGIPATRPDASGDRATQPGRFRSQ